MENPEMKRRRYTPEFKKEAAKLMIIDGQTAKEASEQLGVSEALLYRWKSEHIEELEGQKKPGDLSPKEMADELAALRKQLAKSQWMNEILKKTVGYFSKED